MNIKTRIREGFYNRLTGESNTFRTAITLSSGKYKLFYHIVPQVFPQTTTPINSPYVVLDILPINQDRDTGNKFYEFIVQFRVSSLTAQNCEDVAGLLIERLEDSESNLTFTDYLTIRITRESQIDLGFSENIWGAVIQYRVLLQEVNNE